MSQKIITPSIEVQTTPFIFAGINNTDGSVKVFFATTHVEALKALEEYQKTLITEPETTNLLTDNNN